MDRRALLAPLFALGLVGCGSNWSGEALPSLDEVPHWPDCDGDGWGDAGDTPFANMECFYVDADEPVPCDDPAAGARWVENNLDCDDGYPLSGADLTGAGCPSTLSWMFDEPIGPADYVVDDDGTREYLVFFPRLPREAAARVCEQWGVGTLELASVEEGTAWSYGVASIQTSSELDKVLDVLFTVDGVDGVSFWVSATLEQGEDGRVHLVWRPELGQEQSPEDRRVDPTILDFCDGEELDLIDFLPIPAGDPDRDGALAQLEAELLVPVRYQNNGFCVANPTAHGCVDYGTTGVSPTCLETCIGEHADLGEDVARMVCQETCIGIDESCFDLCTEGPSFDFEACRHACDTLVDSTCVLDCVDAGGEEAACRQDCAVSLVARPYCASFGVICERPFANPFDEERFAPYRVVEGLCNLTP